MENYDYYIVECHEFKSVTSSYDTALGIFRDCATKAKLKGVKDGKISLLKENNLQRYEDEQS